MTMRAMQHAFETAIAKPNAKLQICLQGAPPIGPGAISCVDHRPCGEAEVLPPLEPGAGSGVYLMICEAQQQEPGGRVTVVRLPVVFSIEALLWYSPGPEQADQPSILTPFGAGGLRVGRG